MMVLTVVTILFLPASFMASFCALPIAQFLHVESGKETMDLGCVVKWLVLFTVPFAACFISLALYINEFFGLVSQVGSAVHKLLKAIHSAVFGPPPTDSSIYSPRRGN